MGGNISNDDKEVITEKSQKNSSKATEKVVFQRNVKDMEGEFISKVSKDEGNKSAKGKKVGFKDDEEKIEILDIKEEKETKTKVETGTIYKHEYKKDVDKKEKNVSAKSKVEKNKKAPDKSETETHIFEKSDQKIK